MAKKRKPKKSKKSEATTVAARIQEVLAIRLDGAQAHDVLHYASEKGWGLTERQVRTYMQRADDLLVERQETKRKRTIAMHLARREALYARAINAADLRTALAVLADLARLQSLYADGRDLKDLLKLTAAQDQRIRDLETQIREAALRTTGPTPPAG